MKREQLKPGDLVRPTWDDGWRTSFSSPPTPVNLLKDRPRADIKIEDLFENMYVATLKWTEVGQVIAVDGDWLMVLFGLHYGWALAQSFEIPPEE